MMDRFDALPMIERQKVRFIHLNHTNPVRYPDSPQRRQVDARGYRVAEEGEMVCLD
jgi:pyrroloquinoline quinone biosynthesis protein B